MAFKGLGHKVEQERKERLGINPSFGEILGTVDTKITDPQPQETVTQWEGADGQVGMVEPPPPWELDEQGDRQASDARRFVKAPDNWTLRWINPKLLDQFGWRDWKPVMASDKNIKVHVDSMISPEGNIRRGGATGDILAWMYTSWVESRRRLIQRATDEQSAASVRKQDELRDEFNRGKFGPYIRLEEARHPTHTMAEGASMRD